MNDEILKTAVFALLSAGSGVAIQWLLTQYLDWKADEGQTVSPRTKRRLALLFCVVVPSLLYAFAVFAAWTAYQLTTHLGYIVSAFTAQQMAHGESKLLTGAEVREQQALDDVAAGEM